MLSLLLSCAGLALPQQPAASAGLHVPLAFEHHVTPQGDRFLARIADHSVIVDAHGATVRGRGADGTVATNVRTEFIGGAATSLQGEAETPCRVHCFLGNDPKQWLRDVRTFERARLAAVWPGIDVVWHGRAGCLEYDFLVAPGADAHRIRLRFAGAALHLAANGDLVQCGANGDVRHRAPVAWQRRNGRNHAVAVRYELAFDGTVGFALGTHDPTLELVIDPVVLYMARIDGLINSTNSEQGARIAVDAQGHAIVCCTTASPDLPVQNPFQANAGSITDVFVAKLTPNGTGLVFATYLGGSAADTAGGIAVLPSGDIAIGCGTGSPNFPLQNPAFPGPLTGFNVAGGITVLSPQGALLWSTFYKAPTGVTNAPVKDITADALGNVIVCGHTNTLNLPMGGVAFQSNRVGTIDAYVARFSSGGGFLGATYFGLTGVNEALDVVVAPNNSICVGGRIRTGTIPIQGGFQGAHGGGTFDAWIAVWNSNLSALSYATYVGGSQNEAEFGLEQLGIAVDAQNRVVLASATTSNNLPTSPGAWQTTYAGLRDGFVTMVDPLQAGAASLVFSTYLGGSLNDGLADVAIDAFGNIYVGGGSTSSVLPYVHPIVPHSTNTLDFDGLLAVLDPTGQALRFASSLGRSLPIEGIALGPDGSVFVAGGGTAFTIPVTPGAFATGGNSSGQALFVGHVDVHLATRRSYGTGHPGALGVPTLTASSNPVAGTTFDFALGNSSGTPAFALLAVGLTPAAAPTPFGGTLLVGTLLGTLSAVLGSGGGTIPLALPGGTGFLGLPLFAQQLQVDAGASQGIAFSPGLEVRVGI